MFGMRVDMTMSSRSISDPEEKKKRDTESDRIMEWMNETK